VAATKGRSSAPPAGVYFDSRVEKYDRAYDSVDGDGHALRARLAAALAYIGDGPGEILDAGMGPGRLCRELDRRGWTVYGVDASADMVGFTAARLPHAHKRFLQCDVERLPFADASFDAAVATGVLEYSTVPVALRELARVLRPGGLAVVSYPKTWSLYGTWKGRVFYPAVRLAKSILRRPDRAFPRGAGPISRKNFQELLSQAGLRVDHVCDTSFIPTVSPLDILLGNWTVRLAERVEGHGPPVSSWFATQIVYAARRAE
jgi:SAM-dependent methyltransferase